MAENSEYSEKHGARYAETLRILDDISPRVILEMGATHPFYFTRLLATKFPSARILLAQNTLAEFPGSLWHGEKQNELALVLPGLENYPPFPVFHFNAETDIWPLASASIDLILCMEILEHLCIDPLFLFREAHRVLRLDGLLLVTTPNIACTENINSLLAGHTPYRYGPFSPYGVYGRHNREYVPGEVDDLAKAAGFQTVQLVTRDIYPLEKSIQITEPDLARMGLSSTGRAQNIFYLGRKTGESPSAHSYPQTLYDFDPTLHLACIHVEPTDFDCDQPEPVHVRVDIENHGGYTWSSQPPDKTRLGIQILGPRLDLWQRDFHRVSFSDPVPPGASVSLNFDIPLPADFHDGWLKFDIVHEQVCWFGERNGSRPNPCLVRIRRRSWEELGKQDPLWNTLTESQKCSGKSIAEFFQSGEQEIRQLLSQLEVLGVEVPTGRALDFGCGVGRLTQALCRYFSECVGVGIDSSLIKSAKKYNQHGDKCRYYYVNELSTLFSFPDNSFDFIYSNIVLQHVHPEYTRNYLCDFLRTLAPGGILVFQLPTVPKTRSDSPAAGAPLAEDGFASRVVVRRPRLRARPGSAVHVPVIVYNQSSRWWFQAEEGVKECSIGLGAHWLDQENRFLGEDDTRLWLPHDLPPGKEFSAVLTVHAPLVSGHFVLEIDLVQEGVCWFKNKGGSAARVRVEIREKQPRPPEPPQIEMYGIPREDVLSLIQESGGRVFLVDPGFWANHWHGHRYYVTKGKKPGSPAL